MKKTNTECTATRNLINAMACHAVAITMYAIGFCLGGAPLCLVAGLTWSVLGVSASFRS